MAHKIKLAELFTPSPACTCQVCKGYCQRPGWWTVDQVSSAINEGLAGRMMLEVAPDFSFAVLAPSFKGCEGLIAINEFSDEGCNFLTNELCELHGTKLQPLECQVCHHNSPGLGAKCHRELEKQWNSVRSQKIVKEWMLLTNFNEKLYEYQKHLKL